MSLLVKQEPMHTQRLIQSEEEGGGDLLLSHQSGQSGMIMDHDEKRMRRQIANSNERRRMQSINAGFQSLRNLLPHHEGEKLSKAAILQQTAEYIYNLEQEKTRLLSQNCQLKRLLDSQDGGDVPQPATQQPTTAIKKRKLDALALVQTLTDSSDEGLGSMSPEPVSLIQMSTTGGKTTTITASAVSAKDYLDLKHQYDVTRRQKVQLEEQLRQYEVHTTTHTTIERLREVPIQYQHQEVIEHTDNIRDDDIIIEDPLSLGKGQITIQTTDGGIESLQVLSLESIPSVGETQVVVCTTSDMEDDNEDCTMGATEIIVTNESHQHQLQLQHQTHHHQQVKVKEERNTRPNTPKQVPQQQQQQHQPQQQPQKPRIPSILEAAIKAEPKVEVERIDGSPPVAIIVNDDNSGTGTRTGNGTQSRMYLTSTSRQNLETIVEAIRHLEGDHLFGDMVEQEVPLALTKTATITTVTTTPKQPQQTQQQQQHQQQSQPQQQQQQHTIKTQAEREREHRQIQLEINPFLKFKTPTTTNTVAATKTQQMQHASAIQQTAATIVQSANIQQQQKTTQNQSNRVGVIVVKQSS